MAASSTHTYDLWLAQGGVFIRNAAQSLDDVLTKTDEWSRRFGRRFEVDIDGVISLVGTSMNWTLHVATNDAANYDERWYEPNKHNQLVVAFLRKFNHAINVVVFGTSIVRPLDLTAMRPFAEFIQIYGTCSSDIRFDHVKKVSIRNFVSDSGKIVANRIEKLSVHLTTETTLAPRIRDVRSGDALTVYNENAHDFVVSDMQTVVTTSNFETIHEISRMAFPNPKVIEAATDRPTETYTFTTTLNDFAGYEFDDDDMTRIGQIVRHLQDKISRIVVVDSEKNITIARGVLMLSAGYYNRLTIPLFDSTQYDPPRTSTWTRLTSVEFETRVYDDFDYDRGFTKNFQFANAPLVRDLYLFVWDHAGPFTISDGVKRVFVSSDVRDVVTTAIDAAGSHPAIYDVGRRTRAEIDALSPEELSRLQTRRGDHQALAVATRGLTAMPGPSRRVLQVPGLVGIIAEMIVKRDEG
jgi:hypothetical protein